MHVCVCVYEGVHDIKCAQLIKYFVCTCLLILFHFVKPLFHMGKDLVQTLGGNFLDILHTQGDEYSNRHYTLMINCGHTGMSSWIF